MPLKNALSIRQIRKLGFEHGWNAASWVNMPEIGQTLSRDIDWQGIGTIESKRDAIDAWEIIILDNLQNDQSSERAILAFGINSRMDEIDEWAAEDGWNEYESSLLRGIRAYRVWGYPLRKRK